MKKIITKKAIFQVKSQPFDPKDMGEPRTADEYYRRGLANFARKQYVGAEDDLEEALALKNDLLDACYVLGMVQKAQGKDQEAIQAFHRVLSIIESEADNHAAKFDMLRRLALGHINVINQGDWNLEKEIWKHTP